ncbi:uncharacterized protein MELLADRAFT_108667 [Melampsora larici-populina 98AG31]|uniref:C2H2-type domain-containing protein n=1 Tax=Melampsora larici-populina (strain 98AG31 / pathotype 3-4-7) TaxID=747676 RepID=F4RTU9_MELLP|nr:uncharacterized protein MELLADRAFT_108667 [Melampsora larici-populina 98AG31]EGG04064.1 hypothetical protein MELLADRAFT_108667 [Melampsora larici-populina 98AG31]
MPHPSAANAEEEGYVLVPVMYYTVHLLTDDDGKPLLWDPKHAAEYTARGTQLEAAYRAAANRSSSKATEYYHSGTRFRFEGAQRVPAHQSSSRAAEHNISAMRLDEVQRAASNRSSNQSAEQGVSAMQLDNQPPTATRSLISNDRQHQIDQPLPLSYTFEQISSCASQPTPQHLKIPSPSDSTRVIKEEEILVYCPQCHKGFTKVYNLKRHLTTVHRSKKELGEAGKLYLCKLNGCTKAYKNPSDAARHRKVCTTSKEDAEYIQTYLASAGSASVGPPSMGSPSAKWLKPQYRGKLNNPTLPCKQSPAEMALDLVPGDVSPGPGWDEHIHIHFSITHSV